MASQQTTTATLPPAVDTAWQEIEELVDQIARLSKAAVPIGDFYSEVLNGAVSALAASGGAVWLVRPGPEIHLEYQVNLARTGLVENDEDWRRHAELVYSVIESRTSRAVPPHAGTGRDALAANPTEYLLLICPVTVEAEPAAVIEIFQRAGASAAAQGGYLRFLDALAELAGDFHRNLKLRQLEDRAGAWGQFEQFAERVHGSLDLDRTAYLTANEGRRLIECDRLSVLVLRGRRARMLAVSGLDTFDRRANIIRRAEQLVSAVVAADEPLWFGEGGGPLPPQIEAALEPFLDESHARAVAVVPLKETLAEAEREERRPQTLAALLVERFEVDPTPEGTRHRVEAVGRHSALALQNALEHRSLPFFPLLRLLQRATWLTRLRHLPKTALILGLIAAAIAALVLIPADFNISGRGELQPRVRQDVFATTDGIVDEVYVWHGKPVAPDEPLVQLRKLELEYQFKELTGERQTTVTRLATVNTALVRQQARTSEGEDRRRSLAAEAEELKIKLASLQEQFAVLEEQQAELLIKSPIGGRVLTWDVDQLLEARPVQRGQNLLRVAKLQDDSQGVAPWVLEIRVPDDDVGHVLEARRSSQEPLAVSFVLATDPDTTYHGTVDTIDMSTRTDETEGSTVLVTVNIDKSQLAHLRPGLVAIPKIHCGRRSVGYVWFHNLLDTIKTKLLF